MGRLIVIGLFAVSWAAAGVPAAAQPPADPKIWTVTMSAGLALTSGNTDTSTFNAAYDLVYDPPTKNTVKSDGLMIRGTTQGKVSADRLGIDVRDEYRVGARTFVFGQNEYLRDTFKSIDYLLSPTLGAGYKALDSDQSKLGFDGALGAVWEKNPGADVRTSGAITVGEKLAQTLTPSTLLTQSFSGLWKMKHPGDALYILRLGVAAAMSARTQLKVELLNTFKNQPPQPTVKKNDVALVVAFVYKL
jgi:putative salt-induced outer membrane protein YdiY